MNIKHIVENFNFENIKKDEQNFGTTVYETWLDEFLKTKENTGIIRLFEDIFCTNALSLLDKKYLIVYAQKLINQHEAEQKIIKITNLNDLKKEIRRQITAYGRYPNKTIDLNYIDVSEVTDMHGLFKNYSYENKLDISKWDVSNVTNMAEMFYNARKIFDTLDISNWDVSSVTNMSYMFTGSTFTGDISKWNVSNVTDMSSMFNSAAFDGDISNWDVSNVTNMANMFGHSVFNGDISNWDVSNVENMACMFMNSLFDNDISKWNVSNVTNMSCMFAGSHFNKPIGDWDISHVTNMFKMFEHAQFNQDLRKWKRCITCRINYSMKAIFQFSNMEQKNYPE